MFSIRTEQVIQEVGQLERQVSELLACGLELGQAVWNLQGLSGMEDSAAGLERRRLDMEDECMFLNQMMLALNKIILDYLGCENKICGNVEENVCFYAGQSIGMNEFANISHILSGIWEL